MAHQSGGAQASAPGDRVFLAGNASTHSRNLPAGQHSGFTPDAWTAAGRCLEAAQLTDRATSEALYRAAAKYLSRAVGGLAVMR
jgi:hypothetical protein